MQFVKPNAIVRDTRPEAEKDQEIYERSMTNIHHINKQLIAQGHSVEEVLAAAAKNIFGVNVETHAPKPKD